VSGKQHVKRIHFVTGEIRNDAIPGVLILRAFSAVFLSYVVNGGEKDVGES